MPSSFTPSRSSVRRLRGTRHEPRAHAPTALRGQSYGLEMAVLANQFRPACHCGWRLEQSSDSRKEALDWYYLHRLAVHHVEAPQR